MIARSVYRFRYLHAVAWPLLAAFLAPNVLQLLEKVAPFPKRPPSETESGRAETVFDEHFSNLTGMKREMVLFRCRNPCDSAVNDLTGGYIQQIKALVERFGNDHPGSVIQIHSYYTYEKIDDNPMMSHDRQSILMDWVWRVPGTLKPTAEAFLGDVLITIDKINELQAQGADTDVLDIEATGPTFLERALRLALTREIPKHEAATIWVPFSVLAYALCSMRMLLLTLMSMPVRLLIAYGIVYYLSLRMTVLVDVLNLMTMLCTGLTFDYSLFTLSRYAEERKSGASVEEAVVTMTTQSGHVVVVTGCVLMIAYGSMLVLPGALKSFCLGSCAMILVCMVIQICWIPALLACCPNLVGLPRGAASKGKSRKLNVATCGLSAVESEDSDEPTDWEGNGPIPPVAVWEEGSGDVALEDDAALDDMGTTCGEGATGSSDRGSGMWEGVEAEASASPMERASPHMRGCWFWLGGKFTQFPLNVLLPLLIYALGSPLTMRCMGKGFRMGHGFELEIPRHRREWKLALEIQQDFRPDVGCFYPMLIIATSAPAPLGEPNSTQTSAALSAPMPVSAQNLTTASAVPTAVPTPALDVRGQEFFDANCQMVKSLIRETMDQPYTLGPDNFLSVTFHKEDTGENGVECLNYWLTHAYRKNFLMHRFFAKSHLLQMLWDQLVNKQHDAMLTILNPSLDPFSTEAFDLVRHIRRTLKNITLVAGKELPGLTFTTFSATSSMMDTIELTSFRGKIALFSCAMICFLVIAISFGAAFIPVKMFFTVILPITWTYGAAFYVYEDGALQWTHCEGLVPVGTAGIHWTVFMLTPTLMLGLALDYDIFLFTRVWEYRKEGFGDRESIQLGLAITGPIISSAGLIMAFSFGGQLIASVPVANQMGFCLVFSILVDTFIVRTVLVPAMLSLSPGLNWWPAKMPPPEFQWLDQGLSHNHAYTPYEEDYSRTGSVSVAKAEYSRNESEHSASADYSRSESVAGRSAELEDDHPQGIFRLRSDRR